LHIFREDNGFESENKERGSVLKRFFSLLLVSLLVQGAVVAGMIRVPAQHKTIQDALDHASFGDTILVSPGEYHENLMWPPVNGIALIGVSGPELVILDGGAEGRGITFSEEWVDIDSETVIQGFTIRNGVASGDPPDCCGGGIFCYRCSPTIRDNSIQDNLAELAGGGVFCLEASPVLTGNLVSENQAFLGGGGIGCELSPCRILDNTIEGNTAGFLGGGIYSFDCDPEISGNEIDGNAALNPQFSLGGGICCGNSSPAILDNAISDNMSLIGGGVACVFLSSPHLRGNVISGNDAEVGDGIMSVVFSYPTIDSNSFSGNGEGLHHVDWFDRVDARNNWWGDPSGPFHPDWNPAGLGDSVSDYVEFDPWLSGPHRALEAEHPPLMDDHVLDLSPNPFRGTAEIRFVLPSPGRASLRVYDRAGQGVATLFDGVRPAGEVRMRWRAGDLPGGVYFLHLESPGYREVFPAIRIDREY
jgi:hypothetical protein